MKRRLTFLTCLGLALALGAAGILAWQHRQRRQTFYTDADSIRRPVDDALVRKTLWRPPVVLPATINTDTDEYEARLSPDGQAMLFVRGKAGGNADIFIAERALGTDAPNEWMQPRPLLEINTPADELGPELSGDGRTLYFYSNRGGGIGGYDLWMSQRGELGWRPPVNLGSSVNTEFGEYSPALALDGSALYFSSDRRQSPRAAGPDGGSWDATIRDNVPDGDFDLFVAAIEDESIQPAAPVADLNTPHHEGTPSFSPAGDFLYFSSNRSGGQGGFDLYRSRLLRGQLQQPENLGPDVNSQANELDPALSQGGFALHFSSDRPMAASSTDAPPTGRSYNVHYTTSREVFAEVAAGPGIDWASLWSLIAPALLWLLLGLLGLLLMLASIKRMQSRTVSLLTRCLLASLMVHLALLIMLTFWQVTTTVVDLIETGGGRRVILASSVGSGGSLAEQVRGGLTDVAIGGSSIEPVRATPDAQAIEAAILARLDAASRLDDADTTPLAEPDVHEAAAPPVIVPRNLHARVPEQQDALDVDSPAPPSPTRSDEAQTSDPSPTQAIAVRAADELQQVPNHLQAALRPQAPDHQTSQSVAVTPPAREAAVQQQAVQVQVSAAAPSAVALNAPVAAPQTPVPTANPEFAGEQRQASVQPAVRRESAATPAASSGQAVARLNPGEAREHRSQSVNRALEVQDAPSAGPALSPATALATADLQPAGSVAVSAPAAGDSLTAEAETSLRIAGLGPAPAEGRATLTSMVADDVRQPTVQFDPSKAAIAGGAREGSVAALAGAASAAPDSTIDPQSLPALSTTAFAAPQKGSDSAHASTISAPSTTNVAVTTTETAVTIGGPASATSRTTAPAGVGRPQPAAAGAIHLEPSSAAAYTSAGTLASRSAAASSDSLPPAATQPALGNVSGALAANDAALPGISLSAPDLEGLSAAGGRDRADESSMHISASGATGLVAAGRVDRDSASELATSTSVQLPAAHPVHAAGRESSLAHGGAGLVNDSAAVPSSAFESAGGPAKTEGLALLPDSLPGGPMRVPSVGDQPGTRDDAPESGPGPSDLSPLTRAARAQASTGAGGDAAPDTARVRVDPNQTPTDSAHSAQSIASTDRGAGPASEAFVALTSTGTIGARPSVDSSSIGTSQSMDLRLPGAAGGQNPAVAASSEKSPRAGLSAVAVEAGSRRSGLSAPMASDSAGEGVHFRPTGAPPLTAPEYALKGSGIAGVEAASSAPPALRLPKTAAVLGMPEPLAGLARDLRVPTDLAPIEASPYIHRSEEKRMEVVEKMGGSEETEHAVAQALKWMAAHQSADGRWAARRYDDACSGCGGAGKFDTDVATTGLALLSFLAADHTHVKSGPYRENVQRGLDWMISQQKPTGDWRGGETLYSHGIASIAASEALGMTRDPQLIEPVRLAIGFICDARNTRVGGWRYEPGQIGDTSVLGWQVMALVSAKRAGIEVPDETLEAARRWIDLVSSPSQAGLYAYQPGQRYSPSMTAEGMYVLQLLGAQQHEPRMKGSADCIAENPPRWDDEPNTYYWYYATLATFQHQGEAWEQWNAAVTAQLLANQRTSGAAAGSWDPVDNWSKIGGRVYQTAMCTLMLEVYYRYLPLYNVEN